MDYKNLTTEWNKTAIFTAQTYGTKTTVEIDHSDLSLDEVMDAFQTLINGMGYNSDTFKQWVLETAAEYQEEEDEKWNDNEIVMHDKVKQSVKDAMARYTKDSEGYEDAKLHMKTSFPMVDPFTTEDDEKRMDIIGQNGNDGLHYGIDDEDEFELGGNG